MNLALAYLQAQPTGGVLSFGAGAYRLASRKVFNSPTGASLTIEGNGPGVTPVQFDNIDGGFAYLNTATTHNASRSGSFHVHGMQLVSTAVGNAGAGIEAGWPGDGSNYGRGFTADDLLMKGPGGFWRGI